MNTQKAMEIFKSVRSTLCDKLKVKYIQQIKALCIIQMIIESLILLILFLVLPIAYAINRDSVLRNPHDYPILRQFAENPVPVIMAMYVIPLAYLGGGILMDAFLYIYSVKKNFEKLSAWSYVTGTLLYIKVTILVFVILGFDTVDVIELGLTLFLNILLTVYSLWITNNLKKEMNEESTLPGEMTPSLEVQLQSLNGTLV